MRGLARKPTGQRRINISFRDILPTDEPRRAADLLATMRFSRFMVPQQNSGPVTHKLAVVAPHPDDEVIGPGGTLIQAIGRSVAVSVIYLTDGESGSGAAARRCEAEAAARHVGYSPSFLGFHPLEIPIDEPAVRAFADSVTQSGSTVLMIPFLLDDNDDHRRSNELLAAAYRAGYLSAKMEIWAYQVYTPLPSNVLVDITDVAHAKADAIELYASQMAKRDWAHFALGLNAFNARLAPGARGKRYFESFLVLPISSYATLCKRYFGVEPGACYSASDYRSAVEEEIT